MTVHLVLLIHRNLPHSNIGLQAIDRLGVDFHLVFAADLEIVFKVDEVQHLD